MYTFSLHIEKSLREIRIFMNFKAVIYIPPFFNSRAKLHARQGKKISLNHLPVRLFITEIVCNCLKSPSKISSKVVQFQFELLPRRNCNLSALNLNFQAETVPLSYSTSIIYHAAI